MRENFWVLRFGIGEVDVGAFFTLSVVEALGSFKGRAEGFDDH
jgi:hypothetical protein